MYPTMPKDIVQQVAVVETERSQAAGLPIGGFALPTVIVIATPATSICAVISTMAVSTMITPV